MESLYKKKSLKFCGFSKDIKRKELTHERETSRTQRFSILRHITEVIEECKENESKIPKFGKKTTGIPSRAETLKKWKEEKLLKQQKEKQMKKPAFKVGVVLKVPTVPISENKPNQSFGSKLKGSQTLKSASSILKTSQILKKEPSSQSVSIKSASSHSKSAQAVKQTAIKPAQKVPTSTSTTSHIKKTASQESTSSMITRPMSSFPGSNSRTSKESSASFKASQKPLSFKPSFCKGAKFKESTTAAISNVQKTKISLEDISESITEDLVETQASRQIFNCDISHIVPAPSVRKSFAPENFSFCPPPELNFSSFNIDGLSAVYSRKKAERERTSTPLKEADQSSKPVTNSKITSLKDADQSPKSIKFKEAIQSFKSTPLKDVVQSLKSTPPKDVAESLKSSPLEDVTQNLESTPLEDVAQSLKPTPLEDVAQSLKYTSLKDVAQSLKSTPLKEVAQSLKPTPLKESAQSPKSTPLKEIDKSLKSASCKETNEHSIQNSVNEIESFNDVNDMKKQETFSKLEDNYKLNTSSKLFTENESVFNHEQKQPEDDSAEFDKFLAEHGDEPLDTFSVVPSDSIKNVRVSNLNLLDARQSRKLSNEPLTKTKHNIKPNLESINESSENKYNLGATPKISRIKTTDEYSFTPRRSARLAEKIRSDSFESLLNVGRPSIMESLDLDESPVSSSAVSSSGIAYDFDNLHLEDTPKMKRKPKVSLLYTPPTRRRQSIRKSIKGDLISFSPAP